MIIRIQCLMFFAIGCIAWNGVSSAVTIARADGIESVITVMTLDQLTQIKVSDL